MNETIWRICSAWNNNSHSHTKGEYYTTLIKIDDGVAPLKPDTQTQKSKTCINMTHKQHSLPIFQAQLSREDHSVCPLAISTSKNLCNATTKTITHILNHPSHFHLLISFFSNKKNQEDGSSCGYGNLQKLMFFLTQLTSNPEFWISWFAVVLPGLVPKIPATVFMNESYKQVLICG